MNLTVDLSVHSLKILLSALLQNNPAPESLLFSLDHISNLV